MKIQNGLLAATVGIVLVASGCSTQAGSEPAESDASVSIQPASTAAVNAAVDQLDSIVEATMNASGVPGVSVAVVHGDEVVTTRGYGVRSVGSDEPVDADTVFQIASLSKPISGLVVAGLTESADLDWDTPVRDQNPSFALKDPWVSDHVTYGDLFSMRAGLPGLGGNLLESIGYDREQIIERLRLLDLNPFRDSYEYSNFSLTAGGSLAAQAAGMTWEEAGKRELFDPAQMNSTSYEHEAFVNATNKALLHVLVDGTWRPAFERNPNPQAPAGGISSTANDLATWGRIVLAHGKLGDHVFASSEAFARLVTPWSKMSAPAPATDLSSSYGLGMNVGADQFGNARWNHSGAFSNGASTTAVFLPAKQVGIIALTNAAPVGASEAITDTFLDVVLTGAPTQDWDAVWAERMKGVYGEPEQIPAPPANPTPARNNSAYVGTYRNAYVGDFEVREAGDGLEMVQGPAQVKFKLTHLDGDVFTYAQAPELPDFESTVTFSFGQGAQAREMEVSAYDEIGWGTLRRR